MRKSTPETPLQLPIKLDPTSNGEYVPPPSSPALRRVQRTAFERCLRNADRLGMSRRDYLRTTCAAATALASLNELSACGQTYAVTKDAGLEPAAAREILEGNEFIFDVQTHHVSGERSWWQSARPTLASFLEKQPEATCGKRSFIDCFTRELYIKEVFVDSDTDLAVLSALWGTPDINPLLLDEAAATADLAAKLGHGRLRLHALALPKVYDKNKLRDQMQALAENFNIAAWKLYPVWGPDGRGYRLDDPATGLAAIRHGLDLKKPIFAIHKGLPLEGQDPVFAQADDVGPVAKAFPQAKFLIYHSGYLQTHVEGPYDATVRRGVDSLLRSLELAGVGPDGNVWAELGGVWREVMKKPTEAAHVMGKLLKHLGEDRILWGTDAIWYGSPQDQIQAFRAFQIPDELREKHGYPQLTREAKVKIFGLNAAKLYGVDPQEVRRAQRNDAVSHARLEMRNDPQPTFAAPGPRTRAELFAMLRRPGGMF
jgi:predicted TIM-barrel fold metal-dependent hydrolase